MPKHNTKCYLDIVKVIQVDLSVLIWRLRLSEKTSYIIITTETRTIILCSMISIYIKKTIYVNAWINSVSVYSQNC